MSNSSAGKTKPTKASRFVVFASFCGVNTAPTVASFKLLTRRRWAPSKEGDLRSQPPHRRSLLSFVPTWLLAVSLETTLQLPLPGHVPPPALLNPHKMCWCKWCVSVGPHLTSPEASFWLWPDQSKWWGVGSGSDVLPWAQRSLHTAKTVFSQMDSSGAMEKSGSDVVKISCTPAARKMQWGEGRDPPAPEPVFKMNQVHSSFLPQPPPPSEFLM